MLHKNGLTLLSSITKFVLLVAFHTHFQTVAYTHLDYLIFTNQGNKTISYMWYAEVRSPKIILDASGSSCIASKNDKRWNFLCEVFI